MQKPKTERESSQLFGENAAYIEGLYEAYLQNRESVSERWRSYFDSLSESDPSASPEAIHSQVRQALVETIRHPPTRTIASVQSAPCVDDKQVSVLQLISAYRFQGHRQAKLDPLGHYDRSPTPELELKYHGLTVQDLSTVYNTGTLSGAVRAPLSEIQQRLKSTYCQMIGAEYMHITDTLRKRWIQERLENQDVHTNLNDDDRLKILTRLIAANGLENYLHTQYVGQKRFSLEGAESLIPLLDELIDGCARHSVNEVIIGMAHRGRLNMLVNIFGKLPRELFQEFEGKSDSDNGSGDVKYHKGFSSDLLTRYGPIHAVLAFNPSHLEIIDPVVEGSVRARQERRKDHQRKQVASVLIHGDAAFAGQGVVMETLNLSETRGYSIGGTVHIIVNNQIGFTTSDPLDSRSTLYCTDVAKMVQAPIFHVNGDDPEAVVFVTKLAVDYRMEFNRDVVIDLVCYRRHGHSEADEPSVTQPMMYETIKSHPRVDDLYAEKLAKLAVTSTGKQEEIRRRYKDKLTSNQRNSLPYTQNPETALLVDFKAFSGNSWTAPADTRIEHQRITMLGERMTKYPDGFRLHKSVAKILNNRHKMSKGEMPVDWGFAETLAHASLLEEGYAVRLSGQDSSRGTFFHRHAVLHDQLTGKTYVPLQHLFDDQPLFLPIDSLLSELAVLGFEMGYSTSEPNALVTWEAQFGDFANNAQVVIDQFISSSEAKWQRFCGLVMLLPHGFDGQGPEHSSARLERYLQLCAEENIQVCTPSTPAQMFHLLRRQMLRPYRKPLIIMSPKSLLRHKLSTSTLEDFTSRGFSNVIDELDELNSNKVTRLILCDGKIYFDLLEARREHELEHIAIARIEQLYPFPKDDVITVLKRYPRANDVIWVQEEPRNQGAWFYMQSRRHLPACLEQKRRLNYAGRGYSASPAVGYLHLHLAQQRQIVSDALQLEELTATSKRSA